MNIVSAKRASEFTNIQKTDSRGRVTHALVPGHKGVWYEVLIKRYTKGGTQFVSTQCTCTKDMKPCKGNLNNICYHSLAAIIAGAEKTNVRVSFCETKDAAEKLTHIGGTSYVVHSLQSKKAAWMIARVLGTTVPC